MIHIQSAIAYGIATGSNVLANSLYILENMAILLIFAVGFYTLGLFMSRHRERELYYGTCNGKHLGIVLRKLKLEQYYYETEKGPRVD
jgi:putative membrane protein